MTDDYGNALDKLERENLTRPTCPECTWHKNQCTHPDAGDNAKCITSRFCPHYLPCGTPMAKAGHGLSGRSKRVPQWRCPKCGRRSMNPWKKEVAK